jgi:hypothetical protein
MPSLSVPLNLVEEMEILLLTSGITLVCLQDTLVGVIRLVAWSGTKLNVEALIYASVFNNLLDLSVTKTNTGRMVRSKTYCWKSVQYLGWQIEPKIVEGIHHKSILSPHHCWKGLHPRPSIESGLIGV